jgi:histidyl-tRNA synthetase
MSERIRFQAPKGTRDFYPPQMAVRRRIEEVWRRASIDCGFEEIEGPSFEHLDLYTLKSGEGIVSELFSFRRAGGDDDYALRPEFTPTLARMAAAKGHSLPLPTKWFAIPSHYRAERPQRGRLREFLQWNADAIGLGEPDGEAEVIEAAVLALERFGLSPRDVQVRISHREAAASLLRGLGTPEASLPAGFELLDRLDRLPPEEIARRAAAIGLDAAGVERLGVCLAAAVPLREPLESIAAGMGVAATQVEPLGPLQERLRRADLLDWCTFDPGIVRGLAYYRGIVFEIHETGGAERAVAGGGRYDGLISLVGGPDLPACGMGMGDVVLSLVLRDRGLLAEDDGEALLPRPDAFVLALSEEAAAAVPGLLRTLRRAGLHARASHRATRNVGKLLADASRCRARHAVILDAGLAEGRATLKDLDGGQQAEVPLRELAARLAGSGPT